MSAISLQINTSFASPVKESWGASPTISPVPAAADPPKVTIEGGIGNIVREKSNIKANYTYDQDIKQIIITLRNEDTGEIVRQFPPEKILKLLAGFAESIGNKVDLKV